MAKERGRIIELVGVTAPAGERHVVGLTDAALCLARGEAAVVTVPRAGLVMPLADLCTGLEVPEAGVVRFLGQGWEERGHGQVARDRRLIGRVWPDSAWVGNLDIDENILLPQWHHTGRSQAELREEAMTLARAFGLDDLPRTRPTWTPEETRRKSQWVRALMGTPKLLLLEYPDDHANEAEHVCLVEAVEKARTQGAAVIWMTSRSNLALTDRPGAVLQADLMGPKLIWRPKENRIVETTKDDARE